ncbi:MAG: PA14 domain-containing protein, partial [Actinomycetota bacterium]
MSMYGTYSRSCWDSGVEVYGIDGPFDANTIWTNQPAEDNDGLVSTTQTNVGGGPACPAARVDLDVTSLAQRWWDGDPNHGMMLRASDEVNPLWRKSFASGDGLAAEVPILSITYNTPPPIPTLTAPDHEAVEMTTTPTLTADPVVDVEGSDVEYWFRIWTSDDEDYWGGQVIGSGWLEDPTWTVPEGNLSDAAEYHWAVFATDGESYVNSDPRTFEVNLRLGEDGASSSQDAGPVSVNLSTGNAHIAVGAPSIPGGASFDYNSQTPPQTGLMAHYYNDLNNDQVFNSGDGDPVVERVDSTIGFAWGEERSPYPGLNEDNFLVRWEGWLTVPEAGDYTFGGTHDRGMRIWVDGQQVYDQWTTPQWLGGYGTTQVSLTAGQKVSIKVEYGDTTGDAFVALGMKKDGGDPFEVPSSWLKPKNPPQDALPQGWEFQTALDSGSIVSARIENDVL